MIVHLNVTMHSDWTQKWHHKINNYVWYWQLIDIKCVCNDSIDPILSGSCWVLLWSETVLPMGVGAVTLITGSGPFGPIGATSSASARRWINSFIKSSSSWELDESFFILKNGRFLLNPDRFSGSSSVPFRVPGPFSDQTLKRRTVGCETHMNDFFKVPDVSDKIEMDVRVVELIEFPPTEFTISNIFRGSFWALESIIFSWYFCRMKKYFILCLIQKLFLKRPGIPRPNWTELGLTRSNRFVDSEWFLLVDIFCTVLLLVLLQSAIKSAINGRFSGLVWKQPSIIFRRPSVIKQPTSNWRYSPLFTFCRVSLTYQVRIFLVFSLSHLVIDC